MAPAVTSVAPNGGPQTGGTRVVITGTGFTGSTNVLFGGVSVPLFVVDSNTQITAVSPPEAPGAPAGFVVVQVTGPSGTSDPEAPGDNFTYVAVADPAFPVIPLLPTDRQFSLVDNLRMLVGERVPVGGDKTSTRFSDDELADSINRHGVNLYLAAAEIWSSKAAMFTDMIDISESGSERRYSQLFRQASQMAASYQKAGESFAQGLITRPIGKVARILDPNLGSTFDGLGVQADLYSVVDPWRSPTARFWPRLVLV